MIKTIKQPKHIFVTDNFQKIRNKIEANQRINKEDALFLFKSDDLLKIADLANLAKWKKHENRASYLINRYINYSNVCVLSCQFCAFSAKKKSPHAFAFTVEEITKMVSQSIKNYGITEVHIVGGLHPSLDKNYYLDMLKSLKNLDNKLHIKAFTAIEIRHLAKRIFKLSIKETLDILKNYGLNSLTGGGAEIFNQEVRDKICKGKETAEQWSEVHQTWHQLGGRSTATMLFGHLENYSHRIDHLDKLRNIQDKTLGFTGFVPLPFVPETTILNHVQPASAFDKLKTIAISRIYLDNFENITAYWIGLGLDLASLALNFGANDLHGTIEEEKIFHMAGANTPQFQQVENFKKAIIEAGCIPYQRNSLYELSN